MIHLLWPTARPKIFLTTYQYWIDTAVDKQNIRVLIAVDTEEDKIQLPGFDVIIVNKDYPGVAYVSYILAKNIEAQERDIIILASDDFFPPKDWDIWITDQLSDFDGCLLIRDGYQTGGCVTLPIMTFSCLLKLNRIIYHPTYRHQYSDAELYDILTALGLLKERRGKQYPLFEHRHWACGKRKLDQIDARCNEVGGYDHNNYKKRIGLSVKEKLEVKVT